MSEAAAAAAAERVARESYGRLVAFLAARTRDVPAAEDALGDAFAAALRVWPREGPPANPEGWLAVAARRRLADSGRRRRTAEGAAETLRLIADELGAAEDSPVPDRRLALMFACTHPAIEASVRAPLMLQTVLGLDAAAIASAFLVKPAAMGQRLSRAKARIKLAGVPFREPAPELWLERIGAVLEAIYAAFSHGWFETGEGRGQFAQESIWLGRAAAELAPGEPEAAGLLALMLYAHSRRSARRDGEGRFTPLSEQNVAAWDHRAIDEAERLLAGAARASRPGRFQIEAAIQSAHVARRATGATDWPAIAALYNALLALTGSAVVAVNRAVAIARAVGPTEGLAALPRPAAHAALATFQAYWAARADLEASAGLPEARECYARAIGLEADPAVRAFLQERLAAFAARG